MSIELAIRQNIIRQETLKTIPCSKIPVHARFGIGGNETEVKEIKCIIPSRGNDRLNRLTSVLINGGRGYWKESINISESEISLILYVIPKVVDQATEEDFISCYLDEILKIIL